MIIVNVMYAHVAESEKGRYQKVTIRLKMHPEKDTDKLLSGLTQVVSRCQLEN